MAYVKTNEQQMTAAAKKIDRERDAAQAMKEYEAEKARIEANTERLRGLRLAKEAADAQAAETKAAKPAAKSAAKSKARAKT